MTDEIDALREENVRLREALEKARGPVTFYAKGYGPGDGDIAALTPATSHE